MSSVHDGGLALLYCAYLRCIINYASYNFSIFTSVPRSISSWLEKILRQASLGLIHVRIEVG